MGREIREVPINFEHPKDDKGHYVPLYDKTWQQGVEEWQGYGGDWEDAPDLKSYRLSYEDGVEMGFCLYENVTEGTPVSPIFKSKDEVIAWCVENNYSAWAIEQLTNHNFCFSGMINAIGYSPSVKDLK